MSRGVERARSGAWPAAALALCSSACGGQPVSTGLFTEPIEIANGQFIPGALPTGPAASDGGAGGPSITQIPALGAEPLPVYGGEANVGVTNGYASPSAASVAARFTDMGTGFWVVPVGVIDSLMQDDHTFGFKVSFNPDDPPGHHPLELSAIDAAGHAGPAADIDVCIAPKVPDYTTSPADSHTCRPDQPLPPLVISMKWDAKLDVDLTVALPDGTTLSPKAPNPEIEDGGAARSAPYFDRDSLRGCYDDGYREEDLIFPTTPEPGQYLIYADPFAACGTAATVFTATVYEAEGACPGCAQVPVFSRSGQLLGTQQYGDQTTGGTADGLYVGTYTYP